MLSWGCHLERQGSMKFSLHKASRRQSLGFLVVSTRQNCLKCFHSLYCWKQSSLRTVFLPKRYDQQVHLRVPLRISSSYEEQAYKETVCKQPFVSELTRDQLPTERLTWEDIERVTCHLVSKIKGERYEFDAILAITRGGLVPATIVAETLEVRTVFVATVIFYGDKGDPFYGLAEPRILFFPENASLKGRKVLIVDDVWDTGRTCKMVAERCVRSGAECKTAVLHYKPSRTQYSDCVPDFFSVTTDRWIIYPWELHSPVNQDLVAN